MYGKGGNMLGFFDQSITQDFLSQKEEEKTSIFSQKEEKVKEKHNRTCWVFFDQSITFPICPSFNFKHVSRL